MIKKFGTYTAITALAVVVLLLFQMVGMSLGLFDSDYEINRNALNTPAPASDQASPDADALPVQRTLASAQNVYIVGETAAPAVEDACAYLRMQCSLSVDLTDAALNADILFWTDEGISLNREVPLLLEYCKRGGLLVFAQLPYITLINKSAELRELLGIQSIAKASYYTKGTCLYSGLLLGGQTNYKTLRSAVPWLKLSPGYSIYMSGYVDSPTDPVPETLPLMWRTKCRRSFVFVCNHDYLLSSGGAGFVNAIFAKTESVQLYPVVNAQTMTVQNYPYLSNENGETMTARYSQSSAKLFYNVLLPAVTAVFSSEHYPLNCSLAASLDASVQDGDISWNDLSHYVRLIVGRSGEMGLSGYSLNADQGLEKLKTQLTQLKEQISAYTMTVFCPDGMSAADYLPLLEDGALLERINTVLAPFEDALSMDRLRYLNDRVVSLPVTHDGFHHTDETDIILRSMETSLLMSNLTIDMKTAVYPAGRQDDWSVLSKAWTDTLAASWQPFQKLDKLNLSEADSRARCFLNLDYNAAIDGDSLTVDVASFSGSCYFLLRAEDLSVSDPENAVATKLEDGVYLIEVTGEHAVLTLESVHEISYH